MTQTATITLTQPIQRGETAITELTLRKPLGGDLRGLNVQALMQADYNACRILLPRIAMPQLLETDLDQMPAEDIAMMTGEIIGFFMPKEVKAAIMASMGQDQSTS